MLNMSNQFYDYLSTKLLDYFDKNALKIGDKFFISFNEDDHVESFYESLRNIGKSEVFSYVHEISGKKYETFFIEINGIKLVVSESLSINDNYLVTLRNKVSSQKGYWENTALLIICKDSIDSISKGMKDLQKKGMPLNIKSISNNLEEEIDSRKFNKVDRLIVKFALTILEEDIFQTTLWNYETILSIINNGAVSDDDLRKLNLFKDDQLSPDLSPKAIKERLMENHETFNDVDKLSQNDDREEKLKKMFTKPGVKLLSEENWQSAKWKDVKKYKDAYDQQKKPLNYIENPDPVKTSENNLTFWERPNSYNSDGRRKRNIIVFNDNSSSEVSLKFSFDRTLNNKFLNENSRKICEARGKSLFVNFRVNPDEPTFKIVRYIHKDQSNSDFTFRIAVLNINPEMIESIKSRYTVFLGNKKQIEVTIDEDSFPIEFGLKSLEKNDIVLYEDGGDIYLYDNEHIMISEDSPVWDNEKFYFNLHYKNNRIPFLVKQKYDPPKPRKSYFIWNLKRKNQENFIFNGVTAVQDVNSFSLYEKFKEYLKMEEEIIDKRIFYARNLDGSLEKENVVFSKDLEDAYLDILDYYRNYDDSPIDNLPSLFFLNDEIKEKYEKFIDIFNKEICGIEPNCILSEFKEKKDLLKLGRIDTDNEIMYSPLSPLNIAYQLEIDKQCKNEDFPSNISKRLVPNNLIPYIYSDNGNELFRPIYQDDAHEWLIYKKTEQVSIGTTNAFISNVVNEKLNQFVKHFEYLFSLNNSSPIRINLINIKDDKEVVKGVFNFIRNRLPDKLKTKKVIPVEINIYEGTEKTYFENLFDCQSEAQFEEEFGIKNLSSDIFDAIDIIHMVQDNISYYKHQSKKYVYEYAHISFFKVNSLNDNTVDDDMNKVETGLSLNGLLSSVSSTSKKSGYRLGFGIKNIPKENNRLINTTINLNELAENSKNGGMGTYSKRRSISSIVELDGDNIHELTKKSQWVTFIEPTFGLEFFDTFDEDMIIIHYSDQYTSSNKYDTITVTSKSTQYEEIIRDFLRDKDVKFTEDIDKELNDVIKIFNVINGEWLLRIISNSETYYDREKLSIISAIKYCLAILDHKDIVWIPVSMEEILRIAGNVKLDKKGGIFDSKLIKGNHSDDLLFIGVKFNEDDRIEVIFYPIEVKIGKNKSNTMKKGKNQLNNTYKLLKTQLRKINNDEFEFRSKFYRNFFIQILLSNEQKLVTNNIWVEKGFDRIEDVKDKLLNDEYDITFGLEDYIGIGSLFSFKKDWPEIDIYTDGNKQVIEVPENFAYSDLIKPIREIHHKIQSDNTDIDAERLLSNVDSIEIRADIDDFDEDDEDLTDEELDDELVAEEESDTTEKQADETTNSDTDTENKLTADIEESYSKSSKVRALIGTQKGYSHKVYWEFGHPLLGNRHMLIQGKSGQGKTYFIQRMLKELSNQGIPSIIIDYTDGFKPSQLEPNFKNSLEDKISQYFVVKENFPLNPFKRNNIMIDEGIFIEEDNSTIASRFKSIINSVYGLGIQQSNTLYQTVLNCLDKYGDDLDLNILKEELLNDESNTAQAVLNKLNELLDKNPFATTDFDWSVLDNNDGKIYIIQLTALSKDIQTVITEFILWDLWNYKSANGSEDNPFIVVLDEAHNLDFSKDSPCTKILKEGRKFGWSGWFATQSVKGSMKIDEIAKLENADEKIYFHPTDVSTIAKDLSKNSEDRKRYENELSKLTKGYCIVQGSAIDSEGKLYQPNPLTVKIDEITNDKN